MNLHQYAPNSMVWVDPLGLSGYRDTFWNAHSNVSSSDRTKYQVHHIIPQNIFRDQDYAKMLKCAGMDMDGLDNLIGLPRNVNDNPLGSHAGFGKSQHNTNHPAYDKAIRGVLDGIKTMKSCKARKLALLALQKSLRIGLKKGVPIVASQGANQAQWENILSV
jgi:hypothetical protein